MSLPEWSLLFVGMALQGMVLRTMLRGAYRRHPFVFTYVAFSFLSTVVQFAVKYYYGARSRQFVLSYWSCDFVETLLLLMVIIHLIRKAMSRHRYRDAVYRGLLAGVVATGAISLLLMHGYGRSFSWGKLMTEVGRDYYFTAMILNAVLWCALVRGNQGNKQLYLLTSGLGLQLSGAAIAHALRVTHELLFLAAWFLPTTYLLNLCVWYIALKKYPDGATAEEASKELPPETVESTSLRN